MADHYGKPDGFLIFKKTDIKFNKSDQLNRFLGRHYPYYKSSNHHIERILEVDNSTELYLRAKL